MVPREPREVSGSSSMSGGAGIEIRLLASVDGSRVQRRHAVGGHHHDQSRRSSARLSARSIRNGWSATLKSGDLMGSLRCRMRRPG